KRRSNIMPSDPKSIRKLTAKQLRFMLEYLVDMNATQAAIRAGYSQKTAKEQGPCLLTKVHQFMPQYLGPILQGTALKAEQVVQGLSLLASSDIGDYMKWDSKKKLTLKDISELTPAQRYCIESVEEKITQWGTTIKLRLAKKQPALDSLAQYWNLFKRTTAAKGLWVTFEDGTMHGGTTKTKREGLEHMRRPVEVTFEDAEPGPTMKGGNGRT
ncbi:MAG TPA: terminase small subunit, partial [Nitrospiraceae bacterium]|nr:terminase small subunit [Nitrospiraceae bacterium]